jgi:prolyl oligopeptidase
MNHVLPVREAAKLIFIVPIIDAFGSGLGAGTGLICVLFFLAPFGLAERPTAAANPDSRCRDTFNERPVYPVAGAQAASFPTIQDVLDAVVYRSLIFTSDGQSILAAQYGTNAICRIELGTGRVTIDQVIFDEGSEIQLLGKLPDSDRLLVSADKDGNERFHVFVESNGSGWRDITPGEQTIARFLAWKNGGNSFFVSSNERDEKFSDVYEYSTSDLSRKMAFENKQGFAEFSVSPNGEYLAARTLVDNRTSHLFLYDLDNRKQKGISDGGQGVHDDFLAFAPDGASIFYRSDRESEFFNLYRYDIRSGARNLIYEGGADVTGATPSPDGESIAVVVMRDSASELLLVEVNKPEQIHRPFLPPGHIRDVTFSLRSREIAFVLSNQKIPGDVFTVDARDLSVRRLTDGQSKFVDIERIANGEVVYFEHSGFNIPGILYRPPPEMRKAGMPAVIFVHGGPGSHTFLGWNPGGFQHLVRYLTSHGIVVYASNHRGTQDFGKTFYHADDLKHSDVDLSDVVASKEMLADVAGVDANRVAIMGLSYGGTLALLSSVLYPDTFKAAVDVAGVVDWEGAMSNAAKSWGAAEREYVATELGDIEDRGRFGRISAVNYVDEIDVPLLIIHGVKDLRVPMPQVERFVEDMKRTGRSPDVLFFEDEGHDFVSKKSNQEVAYQEVLEFLQTHLK